MKIQTSRLVLVIAIASLVGGCATAGSWDSHEVAKLKATDAKMVADDVVEVLVTEYAPGQTTFAVSSDKQGAFGVALENKLRETGYAIASNAEEKPLHAQNLAYVLDELGQPGTYRIGVRVAPIYRMERLYQVNTAGSLVRSSGVTVRSSSNWEAGQNKPASSIGGPIQPQAHSVPRTAQKLSLDEYGKPDMNSGWSVQVIAGADFDDLERHQNYLSRLGYEAHLIKLGNRSIRALRIGPFRTAGEARTVFREMRAGRYGNAFVVEPKRGGGQ